MSGGVVALADTIEVLAKITGVDLISGVLDKVSASFGQAADAAELAANAAAEAGAKFDEGMLVTATGADALDVASAKAATAQEKLAAATREQAAAEQSLIDVRGAIASEEELAQAAREVATAQKLATDSAKELARAQEVVTVFKEEKVSADLLTAAMDRLGTAQKMAATFSKELSAAQERQNALLTESDASAAADRLAKAERNVATASKEASAAQERLRTIELSAAAAAGDQAAKEELAARAATADAAANDKAAVSKEKNTAAMNKAKNAAFMGAAAVAAIGYESVKSAMDFQTLTQRLVTTAGESQSALGEVRTGIMRVAQQTGTSANDLAKSMYTVEAAGFDAAHGGMDVLKASTEGAQLEGSDFGTVANAVTDILKDYHKTGAAAAQMTSQLVAAVSSGKANFQTMSAAMANVLPLASAVGIKFNDVAGVLAEMTSHGVTAQRASQNLAMAIRSLEGPSGAMIKEWGKLGISTQQVTQSLSSRGLGGTLDWLAKTAAAGAPKIGQTYAGALKATIGTAAGLNVMLMTTGKNSGETAKAIARIGAASADANGNVKGFSEVQKTAGYQMNALKASITNTGIAIGTALLPAVVSIAKAINQVITPIMKWVQQHQSLVSTIFQVVAALIAFVGVIKAITMAVEIFEGVMALLADTNPIILAIVAIALILMYCWTHFKTFREVVMAVMSAVGTAIKAVVSAVVAAFHWVVAAAQATWHGLETAWHAVVGAAKAVWGFLTGIWNDIASITTTVWNGIKGFFEKWWPLLLLIFATPIALLIGAWNHFHAQIMAVVHTVWNAIKSFLSAIWSGIKMAAQAAWTQVQLFIVTPIKIAWSMLMTVVHAIASALSVTWQAILGVVKGAWNLIKQAIIDPLLGAWKWLMGWVNKFTQIGVDIVNGIINGLDSAASWLFDKLKNLASGALNAAKSILGINSPSKVFADHIGRGISEGIAFGIEQHGVLAHNALRRLSVGLMNTGKTSLGNLSVGAGFTAGMTIGGLGGVGAGAGGSIVNIHVHAENSTLMTDRDMDVFVQKIEKRLATVILPSGGYRSKF